MISREIGSRGDGGGRLRKLLFTCTGGGAFLSRLIESVTIYPDEPDGPQTEVVAKVEDLIAYVTNDNAAREGGVLRSVAVVAGAGSKSSEQLFQAIDYMA